MTLCSRIRSFTIAAGAILALITMVPSAHAHSDYFDSDCAGCHTNDTPTCNGCHHHKGTLSASANQTSYNPGAPVTVTLSGGTRQGWIRAILYDQNHTELTRRTGPTGMGDDSQANPVVFPVQLTTTAPTTPGDYVWQAAWYGNNNGNGHTESGVNVTIHVVQNPADVADEAPVVRRTWGRIKSQYR